MKTGPVGDHVAEQSQLMNWSTRYVQSSSMSYLSQNKPLTAVVSHESEFEDKPTLLELPGKVGSGE